MKHATSSVHQLKNKSIEKKTNLISNGAREVELGSLDVNEDGEYNDVIVEASEIVGMQGTFLFGSISFDHV